MYYVIAPSGVVSANTLKALNVKMNSKIEQSEFTIVGKDFVTKMGIEDIDFVQDKHKMENLCFASFFRKDNSVKFMSLFLLIMNFIQLILIGNIGK